MDFVLFDELGAEYLKYLTVLCTI